MHEDEAERLRRRAARERTARKEAERLLEVKSRELFDANQRLEQARQELEKRVEQRTRELAEALRSAQLASNAKSTFLTHMTHELRTPLTSILGYTADLRRDRPEDTDLQVIERNARHLLTLINDVLDLAKVESGTLEIHPVSTELHAMIDELEAMFGPPCREKGLTCSVSVASNVPSWVKMDAVRVRQILINYLGNALKYTDRGAIGVRVLVIADDRLRFDVLDTGRGISQAQQASLFQPFTQGNNSEGTGLGLAIAARLADLMGGHVDVSSALGRGSCFSLVLPIELGSPGEEASAPLVARPDLTGVRVLIADDASDSRRLLVRWCATAGAEAVEAHDGVTAVELAQGCDIVLMDQRL